LICFLKSFLGNQSFRPIPIKKLKIIIIPPRGVDNPKRGTGCRKGRLNMMIKKALLRYPKVATRSSTYRPSGFALLLTVFIALFKEKSDVSKDETLDLKRLSKLETHF
jgi:hypothetical protein